ncbi:MAG: AAA family ATPase [Jatrophihabitantaceae bacterium]
MTNPSWDEEEPRPIAANTGGPVDPNDHIGHDDELEQALISTDSVGALLTGDRRMGKTSLLRKVESLLCRDHVVLRVSAETGSIELFADRLLNTLRRTSTFAKELENWHVSVDVGYHGFRLQRTPTVKSQQASTTDDLFSWAAKKAAPRKLIVIIDEITVLAQAVENTNPGGALELLRNLRRPRQELDNVVVLLAGSVGLHHATSDFAPLNDLRKVRVGALELPAGKYLARCLLLGEGVPASDERAVAEAIYREADGIAYYIHNLVASARRHGGVLQPQTVAELRQQALVDPDDPWDLRHYDRRIDDYYGERSALVRHVLDIFATASAPLTVTDLAAHLLAVEMSRRPSRDELLLLLEQLEADHYLLRSGDTDTIASTIIRDAWRSIRRLG